MVPALAVLMLLTHPPAWRHVQVTRHSGAMTATLAYDARSNGSFLDVRDLRWRVVLHGRVVFRHGLATRGADVAPALTLANVWGNDDPEAIVELQLCGNRCWRTADVVIATTGRVVVRQMGLAGWKLEGSAFVSQDSRLFCEFSDCASSGMPIQILGIDAAGRQFVDVTNDRLDLVSADARQLWLGYRQERKHAYPNSGGLYPNWFGTLVPYCADEYRLGVNAFCDRKLPAAVKRRLTAWGYR